MKKCSNCKLEKPLEDFYNDKHSKDLKTYECKDCYIKRRVEKRDYHKNYQRELRKTDNEKVKKSRNLSYQKTEPALKLFRQAKQRSDRKLIDFNIDVSDIIIPEVCPLLNVPFIIGTNYDYEYTHSIDRIDTTRGYVKGNVWVVSKKANSMKNSGTIQELLIFAKNILEKFKEYDIVQPTCINKDVESKDKEL